MQVIPDLVISFEAGHSMSSQFVCRLLLLYFETLVPTSPPQPMDDLIPMKIMDSNNGMYIGI